MRRRDAVRLLAAMGATGFAEAERLPGSLQVLVVGGFNNHDDAKTTGFLKELFTSHGHTVEVSGAPDSMGDPRWKRWRPRFSRYDVVVQTANNIQQPELRWPRQVERALEKYVRKGGGLLVFHSANNAFPHWEEYNRMIGLGWRPAEYGAALKMDAAGKIARVPPGEGEKTSHGPRQDTLVHHLAQHPINDGLPARWLTPDIEVYTYARGPAEELTVLSYGRHKATDTWWPLEWAVGYGQGRVYSSSFGHIWKSDEGIPARVRCAGFQTKLLRAVDWVAAQPVQPLPLDDFPSAERTSIRPELEPEGA